MGGALAVHVVADYLIPFVAGLVVIDVVEGTAMDALQSMQNVLRCRPKTFQSLEYAVEWSCRSGQTRNIESAKVSNPLFSIIYFRSLIDMENEKDIIAHVLPP